MGKLAENLLITVVGGVAVMAIWSAIQKKATARTNSPASVPANSVSGLSNSGVYNIANLGSTAGRVYQI